jgi:hypothetical protein
VRPARIVANVYALAAVAFVLFLQVCATQWAPLAGLLGTVPLGWRDWLVVGVLGVVPGVVGQIVNAFRGTPAPRRQRSLNREPRARRAA